MNPKSDFLNSILVMDVGNTATKLGWFADDGTLSGFESVMGEAELARVLERIPALPKAVAIGRSGSSGVTDIVRKHFGSSAPVLELKAELPPGIASEYAAGQAGTDRLANVTGAVALHLHPCVIVDIGSAITLELVDERPAFIGGVILPGMDLQARVLQRGTVALPGIEVSKEEEELPAFPGKSTGAAIEAGIVLGAHSAVDGLVTRALGELGSNATMIYTGGNGQMFAANSRHSGIVYNRHLTLHGLYAMFVAQI